MRCHLIESDEPQSAVSPTVLLAAEAQGMWKHFDTIDDRAVPDGIQLYNIEDALTQQDTVASAFPRS